MKDTLIYFSHDSNARQHPKMKALRAKFGYEGYGMFWALNERIAETSGACIDISKKLNKLDLANELSLTESGLDIFLEFLSDPEIDLINIDNGIITTDRINELYNGVMGSRETERVKKQQKKGKQEIPAGNDDFPAGKQEIPEGKDNKDSKDSIGSKEKKIKGIDGSDERQSLKDAIELATLLLTTHRQEIPDYLTGKKDTDTIDRWANDIEMLIRIDKKPPETIRHVILWAKTPGNFWFPNIQSGKKLRDKYELLYSKMLQDGKSGAGPPTRTEERKSLSGLKSLY